MSITLSSIRCALQIALLGAVTQNLRAINAVVKEKNIEIYFYYETHPSEEEEELSEIVETEIYSYFMDTSIATYRVVLPISNKIPELGIRIFHRKE